VDDDPDETVELPGEEALVNFWLRLTTEVIELSKDLQLTDDDLQNLLARYQPRDGSFACGIAAFVQEIITHRHLMLLVETRPGEEPIPEELTLRQRKRRESGEN
jgi:hypothetical protein